MQSISTSELPGIPPAAAMVDLPIRVRARPTAIHNAVGLQTIEDGVELGIRDDECVVM